jgi:hypothetical protein
MTVRPRNGARRAVGIDSADGESREGIAAILKLKLSFRMITSDFGGDDASATHSRTGTMT